MRPIFILLVMFLTLQAKAQFIYDEYDEIIPFSLSEKYKNIIKVKEIHSLILPSYNNDSLCRVNNNGKLLTELGSVFATGFCNDTLIDFKKNAQKFIIEEGILWIYTIESPTAAGLSAIIKDFDVEEGCYFSVIPGTFPYEFEEPETYRHGEIPQRTLERGLERSVDNTKLVLELFEPNNIMHKRNYTINKICYDYAGGFGQALKKHMEEIKDTINLKSGYYENPNDLPLPCQFDTECSDVATWKSEKKSVCYLRMKFNYQNNSYISSGTGFFLNKQGDYSDTDQPILASCGHLFAPKITANTYYDISNIYYDFEVIIDYENKVCNETKIRYGKNLPGSFNRINLGNSYNPGQSGYVENEDYSVFQTSRNKKQLSKYDILYAGWDANPNYLDEGYAAIGHPKNSVKRIIIENSRAYANSNYFGLYFDKGVSEHGFSGSPVFNNSKKVVGWLCTGNGNCSTIGQNIPANHTTCGKIDNLHFNIASYIDPTGVGSAQSSNPQPPTPPAHCSNCILDYDETNIDCGGSDCYPCGIQDVLAIKTELDLLGNVKSRYEIFAEPDPGTLLALKSGYSRLEAGLNIYLNGGFEVQKGATFYAGIEAELMTEADRGCQPACVNLVNVFTPNGDGIDDYWGFGQAFVTSYDLLIWDRNNHTIYSVSNQPVYENGGIYAWDGTGTNSEEVYYGILTYRDCYGNSHTQDFFTHVYKSATILADNSPKEEIIQSKKVESELKEENNYIKVFPNPVTDQIQIHYNGNIFPLRYKLTDLNGKEIIIEETSNANEQVDLSDISSGVYIIHVKAGDCNLIQQIIKK